jgi:hypothetical protein
MISQADYFAIRTKLLQEQPYLLAIEQKYMYFLRDVILTAATNIYDDFCRAMELKPFWVNYPPQQRGRTPSGTSIPWGEVGEKAIGANLERAIWQKDPLIAYPGLPLGGDIRFATTDALIHFDMKLTGPNDNPDEVVVPPHQISGDGRHWHDGVINSSFEVTGQKAKMVFQPKLPPFYVLGENTLLCLTYFLKAVYTVRDLGDQPLSYLELVCVPNGLLLFDGPEYAANTTGLFIPGKDDKKKPIEQRRTRVRLDPLAALDTWRCIKIALTDTGWNASLRKVL